MKRDEKGYIVVETLGCFLLFTFLMISILSLINIVTLQARMHYAITQAAETVSMYAYTLELTGVSDELTASAAKAEVRKKQVDEIRANIDTVFRTLENLQFSEAQQAVNATGKQLDALASEFADDPKGLLQDFLNLGFQEGLSETMGELLEPLIMHYLSNGEARGLDFLEQYQVQELEFDDCVLLSSEENVTVAVQYTVNYTFGALPLPFGELSMRQQTTTKAWLNGQGEGYIGGFDE